MHNGRGSDFYQFTYYTTTQQLHLFTVMNITFTADSIRRDVQAGIITGLMAIPLSVGICLMSNYPIQTGLTTVVFACVIGFISSIFRPGNFVGVPGVAAGLAPVLAHGVERFGMQNMAFLILLTALLQAIIWYYDLQKYILKAVPTYLVEGLLAGVGLKIAMKFLPYTGIINDASHVWQGNEQELIIVLSIVCMVLFLWLFKRYKKTSPGIPYFGAIALGVLIAYNVNHNPTMLGAGLNVPMLHIDHAPLRLALPFPDWSMITPSLAVEMILFAMMLASIDVIEQVMSNAAIEKLDPYNRPANTNNSLLAIWIANLGSSFFGGMTNLDGLAKSTTNAMAGAVTKFSNLFTGLVILVFIVRHELLESLPYFALAVLMIYSGWKMIAGIFHVASEGKYAFMLSLFCGILVFKLGIFEGLLIALGVHSIIAYIMYRHHDTPFTVIIKDFLKKFEDEFHPHTTATMEVIRDNITGGMRYRSIRKAPSDQKSLTIFLNGWGLSINSHNVLNVVNNYDYDALLWGTFAKQLHNGHTSIKKYFNHLMELADLRVVFDSAEVRQYGDIFIQSGAYTFSYRQKGNEVRVPARYSFVCKKDRNSWMILEHHSSEFPN